MGNMKEQFTNLANEINSMDWENTEFNLLLVTRDTKTGDIHVYRTNGIDEQWGPNVPNLISR